jgi:hypothetical protein
MKTARSRGPLTRNIHLVKWVEKTAELTKPKDIHWVDGSQAEYDKLCREMVASGSSPSSVVCGRAVSGAPTPAMWPGWKTVHLFPVEGRRSP